MYLSPLNRMDRMDLRSDWCRRRFPTCRDVDTNQSRLVRLPTAAGDLKRRTGIPELSFIGVGGVQRTLMVATITGQISEGAKPGVDRYDVMDREKKGATKRPIKSSPGTFSRWIFVS